MTARSAVEPALAALTSPTFGLWAKAYCMRLLKPIEHKAMPINKKDILLFHSIFWNAFLAAGRYSTLARIPGMRRRMRIGTPLLSKYLEVSAMPPKQKNATRVETTHEADEALRIDFFSTMTR